MTNIKQFSQKLMLDVDYEYDLCPIYPTEVIVFIMKGMMK